MVTSTDPKRTGSHDGSVVHVQRFNRSSADGGNAYDMSTAFIPCEMF
jgi:hypothetical protein